MEKIGWTDHVQSEEAERDILHTVKWRKANWIGHSLVGTAFWNTLLKGSWKDKWREDEGKDVSSYWMTLRKNEPTGNWKRKQ